MKPFLIPIASAFVLATAGIASAASVAVFDDASIVDTGGSSSNESDTIQAGAASFGHTVSTFTGLTGASFATGLAGAQVLIMPEPERGNYASLSADARTAIASFVSGGGGLITSYADSDVGGFLNATFGFSLASSGCSTSALNAGNAAGTAFAGGPATLGCPSATNSFLESSLPTGGTSIYGVGGQSTVSLINFGAGQIVTLGWDWFSAAPLGTTGSTDWVPVLGSAIDQVAGTPTTSPVPLPAALPLLLFGVGGLAMVKRRRKKAA